MDMLKALWKRHIDQRDSQARETLIVQYAPLVKYVVGRLNIKLPPSLERDDLISYGLMGLIEAIDRFSLDYEVKFETYAVSRIKGQIIDSLRLMDLLPRSSHRYAREIEQTIAELSQTLGRNPTDAEVSGVLQLDIDEYHSRLRDANFAIVSLDQPITFHGGEETTLYESLEDDHMITPAEHIDQQEVKKQLAIALANLSEREQMMVSLYYNDGLTMKEIGEVLGVSESRVSQMHARTMLTLKTTMQQQFEPSPVVHKKRGMYEPGFVSGN